MKRELWLVIALVAIAAFFRTYRLDSLPPGLYVDEAVDGNEAVATWRTGDYRIYYQNSGVGASENNGHEGLGVWVQALVFGWTGQARPWVIRLPGAIFGTVTILIVYGLGQQLGLKKTAWFGALLLAASLWHVAASRVALRRAPALFFLVGALWIGGRAITSTEKWRGACWALFAGIVYGLGFYTYLAYRVTPLLLLLLWFHQKKANPPRTQIYFAGAIAAGLTILPLLLFVIQHPDIYFQRELFLNTQRSDQPILELLRTALTTISMLHFHGDLNPRQNLPGEPLLIWPVGLLFLVGIAPAWRQHRWLFSWVAVGLLPALLTSEGAPHSGRALLAAPPIYLIAASGADWISTRSCLLFRIIVGAVSISAIVAGYQLYFVTWAGDPRVANAHDVTLLNFSSKVNCMPIELPKYVILDPDPMTVAGLPVAAQTIMFLTDTATQDRQQAKNIHYLWPHQTNQIARGYVWVGHIEMTRP